ncbi:MAG: RNA polymerase sporulation sigma factor SigH [Clostridia bacterium]|nr:RNA polymerase sporulation sigma factor SigH [Clostridia bacterium]
MLKDMRSEERKALSDEALVVLSQSGDDEAMDYLLSKYRGMVKKKARTYFLIGADREDVVQEGMLGLFKAVRDYKAEKNVSFRVFAELCITRQIITAIKRATRQKHVPLNSYISLNRPLVRQDYESTLMDVMARETGVVDPEEIMIHREQLDVLGTKIEELLSSFERKVLALYVQGKSYQKIGDALGKDQKSIDNALQRIRHKIEKNTEWNK